MSSLKPVLSLFDEVPFSVAFLQGPELHIEYINDHNLRIWQRSREEVIGLPLFKARPDIRESAEPFHQEVMKTAQGFKASEVPIAITEDGQTSTRFFNVHIEPVFEDGRLIGQLATTFEITDQVLARRRIEESETEAIRARNESEKMKRLYEAVTGSTPDLVYVFDLQYHFAYANPALLSMWGRSWEEAIGKGLRDLGYEEWHAQMHEREIDQVVATRQPIRGTVSFPHAQLGKRIYEYIFAPVLNDQGDVEAVAGITRDITEKTLAEDARKESEQRFQDLVRDATVGIILLSGPEMKVEIVNEAYGRLIGRRPEELRGKHLFSIIPEAESAYRPILDEVRDSGTPKYLYAAPYAVLHEGRTIEGFLDLVYQPYRNGNGERVGVLVLCHDVTHQVLAQKKLAESEERFRIVADAIPEVIWVTDAEGRAEFMNRRWETYCGVAFEHSSAEEVARRFVHPDDQPRLMAAFTESRQTGRAMEVEQRNRSASGEYRWFLNRATPYCDPATGKIVKWFGIGIDIHDRKLVEEALLQSEQRYRSLSAQLEQTVAERTGELQRSNEDLLQFAHVASHDLKEPVRKIRTFESRLTGEYGHLLPPRARTYLTKISNATERMYQMIEGVLRYSSFNQTSHPFEPVGLGEVITEIASDLEMLIETKGATIVSHDLPRIEGMPTLIYQLFYNLIYNSLKFSRPDTPPRISITAEGVAGEPEQVRIIVADNGIGFNDEDASRIFDPFSRLHPKDRYEGTGLGLALCKRIVERHGGTIGARGEEGKGSRFLITLFQYRQGQ